MCIYVVGRMDRVPRVGLRGGGEYVRKALVAAMVAAAFSIMSFQSMALTAAEPDEVSGMMYQLSTETVSEKMAGPNMFVVNHNVWSVEGDLEGELVSEPRVTIHTDTGEITVNEWATFTGSWNGLEGTITMRNHGTMVGPGEFYIETTVTKGTGDFAGICGWGFVEVHMTTDPPSAGYTFELYWED